MADYTQLLVEETLPNGSYTEIWRGADGDSIDEQFKHGLDFMQAYTGDNWIELWSEALADSPKGFAPFAFRKNNSKQVFLSGMLSMLMQNSAKSSCQEGEPVEGS